MNSYRALKEKFIKPMIFFLTKHIGVQNKNIPRILM